MCNRGRMNKLAAYLSSTGLSQKQFADLANLHPSVVSKFLTGKVKPSLETAVSIERITRGKVKASSWVDGVQQ